MVKCYNIFTSTSSHSKWVKIGNLSKDFCTWTVTKWDPNCSRWTSTEWQEALLICSLCPFTADLLSSCLSCVVLLLRPWSMDSPTSPALCASVPPCSCWPSAPTQGPLNCILKAEPRVCRSLLLSCWNLTLINDITDIHLSDEYFVPSSVFFSFFPHCCSTPSDIHRQWLSVNVSRPQACHTSLAIDLSSRASWYRHTRWCEDPVTAF